MPVVITDQHLRDFVDPTKCKRRVGLRHAGAPEDAQDDYLALLAALTRASIADEKVSLSAADLSQGSVEERIAATLETMQEHVGALFKPLLEAKSEINGTAIILQGSPDFLILGADGKSYTIRLCDASRAVSENSPAEVHSRLKFYSHIFELAFKQKPALEIVDGSGTIVTVKRAKNLAQTAKEDLKNILAALTAEAVLYEPVGRSKCILCPFHSRCWGEAEASQDVSLIKGVDQGLAHELHNSGITSTAGLLKSYGANESGLSTLERRWGFSRRPVGEQSAKTILRFASSLLTKLEMLIAPSALPDVAHYVMFDLEGLPDRLDPLAPIYLWGLQVFNDNGTPAEQFSPATAPFGMKGDAAGWQSFINQAQAIFSRYGNIPFVHWDKYERARLDAYIERLGDRDGIAARVIENLVDLRKVVENSLVLPISSYSLKVVEVYAGYQRSQAEFGTNWSIKKYIEARDTANDVVRQATMNELLKYNQEDLEAMCAVMCWFRQRVIELSLEATKGAQ